MNDDDDVLRYQVTVILVMLVISVILLLIIRLMMIVRDISSKMCLRHGILSFECKRDKSNHNNGDMCSLMTMKTSSGRRLMRTHCNRCIYCIFTIWSGVYLLCSFNIFSYTFSYFYKSFLQLLVYL